MLSLIALTISGLITTAGFGALACSFRFTEGDVRASACFGEIGLFGIFVLVTLGTALNFFVGFTSTVTSFVFGVGAFLFIWHRRLLLESARLGTGFPIFLAAFAIIFKSVVYFTYTSASAHFDTGLYHLQSILQISEEPVIIGQANLHMRFGYNTLWFVLSALLKIPGFGSGGAYVANPTFYILIALSVLQRTAIGWTTVNLGRSAIFGTMVLCVLVSDKFMFDELGTPNTDVVSNSLVLYSMFLALVFSDLRTVTPSSEGVSKLIGFLLGAMIALAVAVKLSAAPLVLLLALVPLSWFRTSDGRRNLMSVAFAILPLVCLWLARGILTSGCIAYPSPASCLPVPWRISLSMAAGDLAWMRSWARTPEVKPELVLGNWNWLPGWWTNFQSSDAFILLIVLTGVVAVCFVARLSMPHVRTTWCYLALGQRLEAILIGSVSALGVAFWFFTAPLPRYGAGWLAVPLILFAAHVIPGPPAAAAAPFYSPARFYGERVTQLILRSIRAKTARHELREVCRAVNWRKLYLVKFVVVPILSAFFIVKTLVWFPSVRFLTDFPNIPNVVIDTKILKSGLHVNTPANGETQCWDAPRPCTPYVANGLRSTKHGLWHVMTIDPE